MATKCPKCDKSLYLTKQISAWDSQHGDEWVGEAMINIICPHCHEGVILVSLVMYDETEEVESPALKAKVEIPKLK